MARRAAKLRKNQEAGAEWGGNTKQGQEPHWLDTVAALEVPLLLAAIWSRQHAAAAGIRGPREEALAGIQESGQEAGARQ